MEVRKSKIIVSNAGGNAGKKSKNYKISLPTVWIKKLILDKNSEVEICFDEKEIIIRKKGTKDEFIKKALENKNTIKEFKYYYKDELCASIYADFTEKRIFLENYNSKSFLLPFGNNFTPTWNDFEYFLEERCLPKSRQGIKYYLQELKLYEYDPLEIIKITKGKMSEDLHYLEVVDIND